MALTLQELLNWPPEIGDLGKAAHDVATNHADSAEFLRSAMQASDWDGESGDTARQAVFSTAADHDKQAERIKAAATLIDTAHQEADALANKVKDILNFAAEAPAVNVEITTGEVSQPASYDYMDAETQTKVSEKIAEVKARIADAIIEGERIDDELAKAIAKASGLPEPAPTPMTTPDLGPLQPGESRNLGPVAGTGAPIDGINAADLGEVITLPDGSKVAILGDSYSGGKQGEGTHYPSVAVPVSFDSQGKAHFGTPLTGPDGKNVLFPLPPEAVKAGANNSLPAGSITVGKDTYMMVVGTNTGEGLAPKGGSWLVKVTNEPSKGWVPVEGSYRPWSQIANPAAGQPFQPPTISDPTAAPTQVSGYQASDGKVYIAADGFDRHQGVTMYRVDPNEVFNRNAWEPWNGQTFDSPGQQAVPVTTTAYGELSFREVDGRPVLSGFNTDTGNTELRVGSGIPATVLDYDTPTTVVAAGGHWSPPVPGQYPQNYGGYILPGTHLDNLGILVSQWNTETGNPYVVKQFQVNANR